MCTNSFMCGTYNNFHTILSEWFEILTIHITLFDEFISDRF